MAMFIPNTMAPSLCYQALDPGLGPTKRDSQAHPLPTLGTKPNAQAFVFPRTTIEYLSYEEPGNPTLLTWELSDSRTLSLLTTLTATTLVYHHLPPELLQ